MGGSIKGSFRVWSNSLQALVQQVVTVLGVGAHFECMGTKMAFHCELVDFCGEVVANVAFLGVESDTFTDRPVTTQASNVKHHLKPDCAGYFYNASVLVELV